MTQYKSKPYLRSITSLLCQLWSNLSSRRHRQFGLLLALMIVSSFAETLNIGAVLPFLGALTAPERIFNHNSFQPLIRALDLTEPSQIILPMTIIFGLTTLIAGGMRLLMLWTSTRLSFAAGADLSMDIYRRTLYQSYAVHCARNSSVIIDGISYKANGLIYSTVVPVLTLISSLTMLIAILGVLLALEPIIAMSAFLGFGIIYVSIIRFTKKQLIIDSELIARNSSQVIKSLQEGLGGIRDILIDGSQEIYCQLYRNADLPLRRAQGNNLFINSSPRFAMEALGMLLIALLALFISRQPNGISKAIPILGVLALGAQRLLPVLQQAYSSWISIKGNQASLQDTLELLDQPVQHDMGQSEVMRMTFKNEIWLDQVSFRYNSETPWVFRNLDLKISKGQRVGFIGTTGSGKSTLLDIVMGLLDPTNGYLKVDGHQIDQKNKKSWQMNIAHVPQAIFLADSTIEQNIAFGVPQNEIDFVKVKRVSEQAHIAETIESWPKKYETEVGERGVRLSGGQRQRIGIARALYKEANIIIFDEATSALDDETEKAVMRAIEDLSADLTILIIAHRLSTLHGCDQIIKLNNDGIEISAHI